MARPLILGLCGPARSGKDTTATAFQGLRTTSQRIQIAGPPKAYLRDLFDWTIEHTDGALKDVPDKRYPRIGDHAWVRSPDDGSLFECACGVQVRASETVPVSECITYLTPREALQKLGGEWAESVYPSVYAARAARIAKRITTRQGYDLAVITDCRFLRDVQALKNIGGVIVHVSRPDAGLTGKAAAHKSEQAQNSPEFQALIDHRIRNEGTIEDLQRIVVSIHAGLR